MSKPDGGLAFPATIEEMIDGETRQEHYPGMTLRDWMAGQALAGIFASCPPNADWMPADKQAIMAYKYADAMIAERDKDGD